MKLWPRVPNMSALWPVASFWNPEVYCVACGLFCSLMIPFRHAMRSFVPNSHSSVSREKRPHLLGKIKPVLVVVLNKISVPFVLIQVAV